MVSQLGLKIGHLCLNLFGVSHGGLGVEKVGSLFGDGPSEQINGIVRKHLDLDAVSPGPVTLKQGEGVTEEGRLVSNRRGFRVHCIK